MSKKQKVETKNDADVQSMSMEELENTSGGFIGGIIGGAVDSVADFGGRVVDGMTAPIQLCAEVAGVKTGIIDRMTDVEHQAGNALAAGSLALPGAAGATVAVADVASRALDK